MKKKKKKFTPGPWQVELMDISFEEYVPGIDEPAAICTFRIKMPMPRRVYNFRKIRAIAECAPEMYEILDQLTSLGDGVNALIRLTRLQNEAQAILKNVRGGK